MNYVLFYPDELRAESLACYGHHVVKTPNMDALAAEGTLFEQNYTPHPVCAASRCSLVTGWYPHIRGHRSLWYMVDEREPNFIRGLRRAGYTTGLFTKNHVFTDEALKESFDVIDHTNPYRTVLDKPAPKAGTKPNGTEDRHPFLMMPDPSPDEKMDEIGDVRSVNNGIEFIRRQARDGKPFFAFFSLFYPHPPYTAPESYYNMYAPDNLPMRGLDWMHNKPSLYEAMREFKLADQQDPEIYKKMQAIYLGMVSFTDMLFGRVVEALKQAGVYDDTVIIVCSDHGDYAGEAQLVEKWPSGMDDMLTRVPLIIRIPGGAKGHRVTTPVSSMDLFPTVFDLAGIPIEHDQFGRSLKAQLEGAPGDAERVVYCEGGYDPREPHSFEGWPGRARAGMYQYLAKRDQQQKRPETVCRTVMRRDARYKLNIRTNGENELYDMQKDPREYDNLYNDPAYADLIAQLKDQLLTWCIAEADVVDRKGHD